MGDKQIKALAQTQQLLKKYKHSLVSLMPPRFIDELSLLLQALDEALEGDEHEL